MTSRAATTEWTFLLCIVLFVGHALSFLFTRWSIAFRSYGEARRTSNLDSASMVMVLPKLHRGKPDFCKLEHTKVRRPRSPLPLTEPSLMLTPCPPHSAPASPT